MSLTPEEIADIVAALQAGGIKVEAEPAEQPVHPALAQKTPVESLLDQLRIDPTPDTVTKVDNWLVESGFKTAPVPPSSGGVTVPGLAPPDPGFKA